MDKISFEAKPKNYGFKQPVDEITNRNITINLDQNVEELLKENKKVDIPFLYNTYVNFSDY